MKRDHIDRLIAKGFPIIKPCPCCNGPAKGADLMDAAEIKCARCGLKIYRGAINSRTLGRCKDQVLRAWNRREHWRQGVPYVLSDESRIDEHNKTLGDFYARRKKHA